MNNCKWGAILDKELINNNEINNVFNNIKELVINSRNKVYAAVNTEMLNLLLHRVTKIPLKHDIMF